MSRFTPIVVAIIAPLALGACAVAPPTGPNVLVLPPEGKSMARFQQEDATCRGYAQQQIGSGSPEQATNQRALSSAVTGTSGSAVGASNARVSAGSLQQRYDIAYVQCMAANGNRMPTAATSTPYPSGPYSYSGAYPAYQGRPGY